VSRTHQDPIKGYMAGQEEHHRTLSFVDELKQLLERNGVEYDPKYFV
jgi:putative transposase